MNPPCEVLLSQRAASSRPDLNGIRAGFPGSNANHLIKGGDEDLAVAHLSRICRLGNGIDYGIELTIVDSHFNSNFGKEIDDIFRPPVEFRVALLPAESF